MFDGRRPVNLQIVPAVRRELAGLKGIVGDFIDPDWPPQTSGDASGIPAHSRTSLNVLYN